MALGARLGERIQFPVVVGDLWHSTNFIENLWYNFLARRSARCIVRADFFIFFPVVSANVDDNLSPT